MRAVATSSTRVLRVGLVQEGRIVEERQVPRGTDVTAGTSEKCTFVLRDRRLPRVASVLRWVGDKPQSVSHYRLCISEFMRGKVALDTGVSDFDALRAMGRRTRHGTWEVDLSESSRGKIVLGDSALLFQLVPEPPAPARPQLPLAMRKNALEIDPFTTVVAAFSFLVHFGVVGALYSDWTDAVVDDAIVVSGIVDSLPAPMPLPDPEDPTPAAADPSNTSAPTPSPTPAPGPGRRPGERGAPRTEPHTTLAKQLDGLKLDMLGALSSEAPATNDVLRRSEVPTPLLDEAARDERGVSSNRELSLSPGAGPVRPGARAELGDLAEHRRGTPNSTGEIDRPRPPVGNVSEPAPGVHGEVSDAARVIAGMRGAWRACYQRGLAENPDAQGSVRLTLRVGSNGETLSVGAVPSGNLPGSVVNCVKGRASWARFSPPAGGEAVVVAPVIFKKQ